MPRVSTINGKRVRAKLTLIQKAERRARHAALAVDLAQAKEAYAQEAVSIADKHGRTVQWARSQLLMDSCFLRNRRRVNAWNAFLKAKIKEINTGRRFGERVKLPQFIAQNKAVLLATYKGLSQQEKQDLVAITQADRDKEVHSARTNRKAICSTVAAAFAQMDREWTALCAKTGIEGFYVAVRGSLEDAAEPRLFFTPKAEKFLRTVLKLNPQRLGLQLESWVVSGIDVPAETNCQRPLNKLVSNCRTHIQENLDSVLMEQNIRRSIKMNYNNYERSIVERYSVALIGWPLTGHIQNPRNVGAANIGKLLTALESQTCKWVILTADELKARILNNKAREARGERIYAPRHSARKEAIDSDDDSDTDK